MCCQIKDHLERENISIRLIGWIRARFFETLEVWAAELLTRNKPFVRKRLLVALRVKQKSALENERALVNVYGNKWYTVTSARFYKPYHL